MSTTPPAIPSKRKRINWKEAAGMRFGRWTVVEWVGRSSYNKASVVRCRCECGNEKEVNCVLLLVKKSTSCGCYKRENLSKVRTTHGHTKIGVSKVCRTYYSVLRRCHGVSNCASRYSGRGLSVCDRWRYGEGGKTGAELFIEDMGEPPSKDHTIERIDNDKGYSPKNCRWATRYDQSNNRCDTRFITYKGRRMSISNWAAATGMLRATINYRYEHGWKPKDILTKPLRSNYFKSHAI